MATARICSASRSDSIPYGIIREHKSRLDGRDRWREFMSLTRTVRTNDCCTKRRSHAHPPGVRMIRKLFFRIKAEQRAEDNGVLAVTVLRSLRLRNGDLGR